MINARQIMIESCTPACDLLTAVDEKHITLSDAFVTYNEGRFKAIKLSEAAENETAAMNWLEG